MRDEHGHRGAPAGGTGDVRALFQSHGLRCTKQREVVYGALLADLTHPTADALYEQVRGQEAGMSLATVYNTLEALVSCGLARRVASGTGGPSRFEADMSQHAHLTREDGRIVDLPPDLSASLLAGVDARVLAEIERRLGVRVRGVSVQVETEGEGAGVGGKSGDGLI